MKFKVETKQIAESLEFMAKFETDDYVTAGALKEAAKRLILLEKKVANLELKLNE